MLLNVLKTFSTALTEKYAVQASFNPEDQLKGPVAVLVEGIGTSFGIAVTTVTEVQEKEVSGRPDMGISVGGLLTGHIELKAPGKGADPKKLKGPDKAQWERFQDLPNLLTFGGAHVIPLWRDAAGSEANITAGVLPLLSTTYGVAVNAEDLFSYVYAVLATPRYVETFWEELRTPGPHLPIPRDGTLFAKLAAAGRELIWLHTYGERFVPNGQKAGRIPSGTAKCLVGTPATAEDYPENYGYNEERQEIRVGKGVFGGVRREVWDFSVSGFQVVDSWLGYRMKERSGKKSSDLDKIRPTSWQFDSELLQLLWVLDATVDRLPTLAALFEELMEGEHFMAADFSKPTLAEQKGPKGGEQEEAEQQAMDFF